MSNWFWVSAFCAAYFFMGIAFLSFPLSAHNWFGTLVLVVVWIGNCVLLRYANRRW